MTLRLDAGPDAARFVTIDRRGTVLGRAPGPGRIDDPWLEPHHLVVRQDGPVVAVTQLCGRAPVRVDGELVVGPTPVGAGAVIELGATRAVVTEPAPSAGVDTETARAVVLGVGFDATSRVIGTDDPAWFVEQARLERSRAFGDVVLDLDVVARVLVTGPSALGVVRSIVAQSTVRVVVTARLDALRWPASGRQILVAHAPDPETAWPGDELPEDAAVISVGATWRAVLHHRRGADTNVVRFHAAGRPARVEPPRGCSRTDRAVVAQQVARTGPEVGGDVVGVPQPARRQREAAAADALVELVPQPRQDGDLLVEPRSP